MAPAWFLALFAPEGWPTSVAPEYGRYQLWDTVQQVTFFVNTVISKQAVMKFHGVGDPTKTPAEASALEMGRGVLASVVALFVATPVMVDLYRRMPRVFRMLSECINATGHFVEILAAIFTGIVAFLYAGPMLCVVAGAMSGSVRAVILQHFARGGQLPPGQQPDFGDISLKESNQDKGGKIFGLVIGLVLLSWVGVAKTADAEKSSLDRSVQLFSLLTVVHILGNMKAVQQLQIPDASQSSASSAAKGGESAGAVGKSSCETSFWKRMFLPKGYPNTVIQEYTRYAAYTQLTGLANYPKQIVRSLIFWNLVYGVGNARQTPAEAVMIDIYMMTVDCIVGLLTGLPQVTKGLDYSKKIWLWRGNVLSRISEVLLLIGAIMPRGVFYVAILVSRMMAAFAGTCASRTAGAIPNALMHRKSVELKEIELIHIQVSSMNQGTVCQIPMGILCVLALYCIVWTGVQPGLGLSLALYMGLQAYQLCLQYLTFQTLTFLPDGAASADQQSLQEQLKQALLSGVKAEEEKSGLAGQPPKLARTRSNPIELEWQEVNDANAEYQNSYSGSAVATPTAFKATGSPLV